MADAVPTIAALQAAQAATRQSGAGAEPSAGEMQAFAAEMSRSQRVASPEKMLVERAAQVSESSTDALAAAMRAGQPMAPQHMLHVQKLVQHEAHAVDIVAKVAGSVSQSVNKLLAMQ